jgi:hypothetical protein
VPRERRSANKPDSNDDRVIKVYVRDLDQLFDSMDPSPFHEKALDRNAHEYIVSLARDLPADAPAELVVYLDQNVGLDDEPRLLGDAIHAYFERRAVELRRELRQMLHKGWIALIVGLTLLISSVIVSQIVARKFGNGPLATMVRESLLIGGWVAMWRPMDFFLYELWSLRADLRVYEQLSRMPVRIVYTKSEQRNTASATSRNRWRTPFSQPT